MIVSEYLLAGVAAWIVAQGVKFALSYDPKDKQGQNITGLYRSGGMPSAHAAGMVSITTVIGFNDGIDSGLFGLAVMLTGIVMYDALMVRRSSGVQGDLLTRLVKIVDKGTSTPVFAKGHTPLEVAVGAAIGLAVGIVVFFATR